jgi:hypothetical protein
MINNLALNKALFVVTGVLAFVAGLWGVLDPGMYLSVVDAKILPGIFTQDLVVVVAALVMVFLTVRMKEDAYRSMIIIFGVLGFLFYAYGIYAIEQIYTALYPLYLTILALSFYGLAYGLTSLIPVRIEGLTLPRWLRYTSAAYSIFIAVMFNIIWISQLIPLLRAHDRIEYTFSVYIIDLVFIMPSFVLTAVRLLRRRPLGLVGVPALFVLGVGILSPLAIGELLAPVRFGRPMVVSEFWLYAVLSLVFLVFATIYLTFLKPNGTSRISEA